MYEDFFAARLAHLRNQKNISAREMSLAIGQNSSYINRIENQKAFPSMQVFFYICEYLKISPKDFFDADLNKPDQFNSLISSLKTLNAQQLDLIYHLAMELSKK